MEAKPKREDDSSEWYWWLLVATITILVAGAASITIWRDFHELQNRVPRIRMPPKGVTQKYSDALRIATQFFDVQKSGRLENDRIEWRGDSGLKDGKDVNADLSKGLYDAGDNMKFGFPMAFTATVIAWSILEYGQRMDEVKELKHVQESLKWITDYLINAHPSDNVLYIQVGDPEIDHKCWERPETLSEKRPTFQVNTSYPGSDIAAETAAAMAAASLVFKNQDADYSKLLLDHAQKLFDFANSYPGVYSKSVPSVQGYYNSSGYVDELLWAASWLYHATRDEYYIDYVTIMHGNAFANWGNPTWFSWDNKLAGTQVLLSRVNFFDEVKEISIVENMNLQMYRRTAETLMCTVLLPSPMSQKTNGGLIWVNEWDTLQYAIGTAFLAVVLSDYMFTSKTPYLYCNGKLYEPMDVRDFAISQADYVLGTNPMSMSYLVGYGLNYPQYVHHRGASIPVDATTSCKDGFKWLNSTKPNPNLASGAVVGGPFLNDTYIDSRNNSMQGEPTTYNSAFFVGLVSGLVTFSNVVRSFT
ncbi:endoglucanase 24-like [Rutidosis leptorrhynchoides]|uniref:endoglucanase 24-like n=1 Tax=Rutidosis leptorrhynchoides TaxID=125765 RepID=UPI003A9A03DD